MRLARYIQVGTLTLGLGLLTGVASAAPPSFQNLDTVPLFGQAPPNQATVQNVGFRPNYSAEGTANTYDLHGQAQAQGATSLSSEEDQYRDIFAIWLAGCQERTGTNYFSAGNNYDQVIFESFGRWENGRPVDRPLSHDERSAGIVRFLDILERATKRDPRTASCLYSYAGATRDAIGAEITRAYQSTYPSPEAQQQAHARAEGLRWKWLLYDDVAFVAKNQLEKSNPPN